MHIGLGLGLTAFGFKGGTSDAPDTGVPAWVLKGGDDAAALDLDFSGNRAWNNVVASLADVLTVSRASGGYAEDLAGNLIWFGNNVLRRTDKGVLVEGSRTNLLTYSQQFDNAAWTASQMVITADGRTAPDGTLTADYQARNSTNNFPRAQRNVTLGITDYALSAFARADTVTWCVPGVGFGGGTAVSAYFDLTNGVVGSAGPAVRRGIGSLVDAWRRVWLSDFEDTGGSRDIRAVALAVSDGTNSLAGQPSGVGLWVWGAQLEADAKWPSSYIPTGGSSATRAADAVTMARAGTATGTVCVNAQAAPGTSGNQVLWQWDDGTENSRYRIVRDSSGDLHCIVTVSGVDEVDLDLGAVANDAEFAVAFSWAGGSFAASLDGATAVTDTSYAGALPTVTTMREGCGVSGSEWFGYIKRQAAWDVALSTTDLEGLAS